MIIESQIILIVLGIVILEEATFGFFVSQRGSRLIKWIIEHLTWQDFMVWFMPLIFFVSHVFVYGFSIENIFLSGYFAMVLHVVSMLYVIKTAEAHYRNILPRLRKRLKERIIRVSEPHYVNLEWMMCDQ